MTTQKVGKDGGLVPHGPTMDEVSFIFGLAIGFTLSSTGAEW